MAASKSFYGVYFYRLSNAGASFFNLPLQTLEGEISPILNFKY
jgi:hypothetical protein